MKVIDLINISKGNFDLVHKNIGVFLHDYGFVYYTKLTSENYYYWWYEVKEKKEINKKKFTYDWLDIRILPKFDFLMKFVKYHKPEESIYKIINQCLNLIEASQDGININTGRRCYDEVFEMYYSRLNSEVKQLKLEL